MALKKGWLRVVCTLATILMGKATCNLDTYDNNERNEREFVCCWLKHDTTELSGVYWHEHGCVDALDEREGDPGGYCLGESYLIQGSGAGQKLWNQDDDRRDYVRCDNCNGHERHAAAGGVGAREPQPGKEGIQLVKEKYGLHGERAVPNPMEVGGRLRHAPRSRLHAGPYGQGPSPAASCLCIMTCFMLISTNHDTDQCNRLLATVSTYCLGRMLLYCKGIQFSEGKKRETSTGLSVCEGSQNRRHYNGYGNDNGSGTTLGPCQDKTGIGTAWGGSERWSREYCRQTIVLTEVLVERIYSCCQVIVLVESLVANMRRCNHGRKRGRGKYEKTETVPMALKSTRRFRQGAYSALLCAIGINIMIKAGEPQSIYQVREQPPCDAWYTRRSYTLVATTPIALHKEGSRRSTSSRTAKVSKILVENFRRQPLYSKWLEMVARTTSVSHHVRIFLHEGKGKTTAVQMAQSDDDLETEENWTL